MRVLLYGGCHAPVLRDYLHAICSGDIECTLGVEPISPANAFGCDTLAGFDAVVYASADGGDADAQQLLEVCRRRGLPAICYPWPEWRGTFPGAEWGTFAGRTQWFYPGLRARAAVFDGGFAAFCDAVVARFPDNLTIDTCLAAATADLRAAEERHGTSFSLSGDILGAYRAHQLFLTPGHPSRALYAAVLARVLERLGMAPREVLGRLARLPAGEPQRRWRIPILPRVARRLGLAFAEAGPVGGTAVRDRAVDLRTYLGLYFFPEGIAPGRRDAA